MEIIQYLKDKPKELKLYSPMYGDLWLAMVDEDNGIITCYLYPLHSGCVRAIIEQEQTVSFFSNGTTGNPICNVTKECMLFPDKRKKWSTHTGRI